MTVGPSEAEPFWTTFLRSLTRQITTGGRQLVRLENVLGVHRDALVLI